MVYRTSIDANHDFIRTYLRIWNISIFQFFRSAMFTEYNGFHNPSRIDFIVSRCWLQLHNALSVETNPMVERFQEYIPYPLKRQYHEPRLLDYKRHKQFEAHLN